MQYEVGLLGLTTLHTGNFTLMTMIVTDESVSFYQDLDFLGATQLPRGQLTDCFDGDSMGLLIGDAGLELGVLRYHPRALSRSMIEELHKYGNLLEAISTGSEPAKSTKTETELSFEYLSNEMASIRSDINQRRSDLELSLILHRAQENEDEQVGLASIRLKKTLSWI